MGKFVHYNYKKICIALIIILTIPIWLTILNYVFDFIIGMGKITGTIIRIIGSSNICSL